MPSLHRRGGVERRLHRRAALTVDGRAADRLGPARDEQRHAPDVQRLLADLADAAHLDVLDLPGVEVEAADEAVQRLRGELLGADACKGAVSPPDRGANGIDDERVGHVVNVPAPEA